MTEFVTPREWTVALLLQAIDRSPTSWVRAILFVGDNDVKSPRAVDLKARAGDGTCLIFEASEEEFWKGGLNAALLGLRLLQMIHDGEIKPDALILIGQQVAYLSDDGLGSHNQITLVAGLTHPDFDIVEIDPFGGPVPGQGSFKPGSRTVRKT
ncbi:MAG: hypothetical protein R3313_00515 [Candidatus Saccharimonadales bacterium]|nr:hypothetical protein [Candidatus Saccharimonadales bacterium]